MGNRLVLGEDAQYGRHALSGDEGAAGKRERHEHHESDPLRGFQGFDHHTQYGRNPGNRERKEQQQAEYQEPLDEIRRGAKANEKACRKHDYSRNGIACEIGDYVCCEKGGTGHGERTKAVDNAALQINQHADRGRIRPEGGRLYQDSGDKKVDITCFTRVDSAAEDVSKEQQEHHRHKEYGKQLIGVANNVREAAFRQHPGVVERPKNLRAYFRLRVGKQEICCFIQRSSPNSQLVLRWIAA